MTTYESPMWKVHYVILRHPGPGGRLYSANRNTFCLCQTAEEAIALVHKHQENIEIMSVIHEGTKTVLVAP